MKRSLIIIVLLSLFGCKKDVISYISTGNFEAFGSIRYITDYKEEVFLHNINLPMNNAFEFDVLTIYTSYGASNLGYTGLLNLMDLKLDVADNKFSFSAKDRGEYELKVKKVIGHTISFRLKVDDSTSIHFENYYDQTCKNKKGQKFRIRTYVSVDGEYLLSNFIVNDMVFITSDDVNYYQMTDSNSSGEKIINESFIKILFKRL